MIKKSVVATVTELVSPVAEKMGIMLWDVEFVKEGSRRILRITIDSDAGIDIDTCESFHRTIDPMLDEADPIEESYYLEVTSPGIERQIKTDAHIKACTGERVELRLYTPRNGAKAFVGVLSGLDEDGRVVIETDGGRMKFEKSEIAKLQTVFDF